MRFLRECAALLAKFPKHNWHSISRTNDEQLFDRDIIKAASSADHYVGARALYKYRNFLGLLRRNPNQLTGWRSVEKFSETFGVKVTRQQILGKVRKRRRNRDLTIPKRRAAWLKRHLGVNRCDEDTLRCKLVARLLMLRFNMLNRGLPRKQVGCLYVSDEMRCKLGRMFNLQRNTYSLMTVRRSDANAMVYLGFVSKTQYSKEFKLNDRPDSLANPHTVTRRVRCAMSRTMYVPNECVVRGREIAFRFCTVSAHAVADESVVHVRIWNGVLEYGVANDTGGTVYSRFDINRLSEMPFTVTETDTHLVPCYINARSAKFRSLTYIGDTESISKGVHTVNRDAFNQEEK